jgi:hypothetical protein
VNLIILLLKYMYSLYFFVIFENSKNQKIK